ncbi:heme-binding protein [Burkholderia sp. WAC0059]|uniref:GlcG/HbpS family heme-binding protein n=1 Tax=Burkholderia sp. WAC0059 TaxID=2066022 RepID=UPI000C7EFE2E|nr:heme-binding protein [Burkholderia sp. WAC0059]PLZ03528.1 heme-binding protein [Burkholderia sp. WAC0059]
MTSLTLQRVRALLERATEDAHRQFNRPVCVSVCDAHGFLAGFFRMDGAPVRSIPISQQKAYTATRMGVSTTAFLERLRREDLPIAYFCDPQLTALPGGAVLTDDEGRAIGGIGISGLAPAEDQQLADALAGLAASTLFAAQRGDR